MQYQKVHNVREIIILYLNNMHKQLYNKNTYESEVNKDDNKR